MIETNPIIMRSRQIFVWVRPGLVAVAVMLLALSAADRRRHHRPPDGDR